MKGASQVLVLFGACLIAGGGVYVPGDQSCRPVTGRFEASLVAAGTGHCPEGAPFCTAGRVWGGIQGTYEFVMSGASPAAEIGGTPTVLFFAGTSVVSLQNGATVEGTDTGSIDLPPGQGGFASLITFTVGGTGQIRLRGEFDAAAGSTSGDYVGIFCDL